MAGSSSHVLGVVLPLRPVHAPALAVAGGTLFNRGGCGGGARGACCSCGASVYGEKWRRQLVAMARFNTFNR